MVSQWSPHTIISGGGRYVLCVLNQPVISQARLVSLWASAVYRVTVDGGTNVWAEIVSNSPQEIKTEAPDLITGDFDSARSEHVKHYEGLGAKIVETLDQDYTDFTKCLKQLTEEMKTDDRLASVEAIFAFVETSGRLDQVMANLETLFHAPSLLTTPVFLISSLSISWLLPTGRHQIHSAGFVSEKTNCGLIPLDGRTVVTTTGLKWNLTEGSLRFGELVSTSNGFDTSQEKVTVQTDSPLLWTMDWE